MSTGDLPPSDELFRVVREVLSALETLADNDAKLRVLCAVAVLHREYDFAASILAQLRR